MGGPMVSLARRGVLLLPLCLLAFATSASAECACVLWLETTVHTFDQTGRMDNSSVDDWSISLATADESLCWKAIPEYVKQAASATDPGIPRSGGLLSYRGSGDEYLHADIQTPAEWNYHVTGKITLGLSPRHCGPAWVEGKVRLSRNAPTCGSHTEALVQRRSRLS